MFSRLAVVATTAAVAALAPAHGAAQRPQREPSPQQAELRQQVEQLRRELADLQAALGRLAKEGEDGQRAAKEPKSGEPSGGWHLQGLDGFKLGEKGGKALTWTVGGEPLRVQVETQEPKQARTAPAQGCTCDCPCCQAHRAGAVVTAPTTTRRSMNLFGARVPAVVDRNCTPTRTGVFEYTAPKTPKPPKAQKPAKTKKAKVKADDDDDDPPAPPAKSKKLISV